jgi:hypothetical protein
LFLLVSFLASRLVMAGFVRNWRVGLIEAHRDLFHPPADFPEGAEGSPACGEGWRDLLERACVRIAAAISEGDRFHFTQVKEKMGTLRVYWSGRMSEPARLAVEEAIDLAEARSACSCEICGEIGRLHHHRGDWLMTRCAAHAEGHPVETRLGFDNIHVVYRVIDGRLRTVACRRYDRDGDRLVDVDPGSLGIEEV